ncbi:DNA-formamidopyrimidine glycosylase [Bacillus horti]|uniref:Formamidopyrimidine-DNA glycosylase n=1 Tax=Caldalkalibacillus horti TaxID=77523 RepID=A0ABT9VT43_9BACI|nr:DNA-formamidopyrimidine glycosylase [Bacillus horti]MDQ0164161.1 formamidopyrimidine-DNA glycosylase [Bacillus horti]
MPELPEVEVVARTIASEISGKVIEEVEVFWPKIVNYPDDVEEFKLNIKGQKIGQIRRTGKYLRIEIGDHFELVVHFRMTGKFQRIVKQDKNQKHLHLFFHFVQEEEGLAYIDVRKFGDIFLVPKGEYIRIKGLFHAGVDPLSKDFTFPIFKELIRKKNRHIKAILLDQSMITGLGNYICDEVLWFEGKKGVHPQRLGSSLTDTELKRIFQRIHEVIQESIRLGGNSFRDFSYGEGMKGDFKKMLKMYGRKGEPCFNCGTEIERIIVAGRSTHYCPKCQKNK